MRKMIIFWAKTAGIALLVLGLVGFVTACKGRKAEEPKPAAAPEAFSLDALKPILGNALDAASGILDFTGDGGELIVSYRYFDNDRKEYDDGLVKDLAPKIEALYKKFKTLDRVVFQISANDPVTPGVWKPYASFALNRKIVQKIEWSGILTADFFANVIEHKRLD